METYDIMTRLKNRLRKEITGSNVALFTTSDIFTMSEPQHFFAMRKRDGISEPHKDYGLRYTYTLRNGEVRRFFTTGNLERAIEQGYVIWVVSTRKNLGPTDSWWTKLVPGSQTILRGPDLASIWRGRILEHFTNRQRRLGSPLMCNSALDHLRDTLNEDQISLTYWVWALTAGIDWPTQGEGEYRVPAFWTSGLAELEEKGFFIRGSSFRDHEGEKAIRNECYAIIKARRTPEEQAEHEAKVAEAKAADAVAMKELETRLAAREAEEKDRQEEALAAGEK